MKEKDDMKLKMFKEKLRITKSNYINMKKRFIKNSEFINSVLTGYSLFLIVGSVTAKFFSNYNSLLDNYFNIIISIILLVVSLLNGNIKYVERAQKIRKNILELNELEELTQKEEINLEKINEKYYQIMETAEVRGDQDYYKTAIEIKGIETEKYKDELSFIIAEDGLKWSVWNMIVRITKIAICVLPMIIICLCLLIK